MADNQPDNLPAHRAPVPITTLLEYARAGLSDTEIAKLVGRSKQTVNERLRAYRTQLKGVSIFKEKRADILAMFQQRLLYSLTDKDIKAMGGYQRVVASGILYDKERLERGKPGQIVEYQDIQAEILEADQELAALERELAELEAGGPL